MNEYWWIMVIFWGLVCAFTIILELLTADLDSIWFFISSLVVWIISAFNIVNWWIQLIIFSVLSLILMIATRPLTKKMMSREIVKTNTDKYLGTIATITSKLDGALWEINVEGVIWRAVNKDDNDTELTVGEKVVIKGINGNKFIISKIDSTINL